MKHIALFLGLAILALTAFQPNPATAQSSTGVRKAPPAITVKLEFTIKGPEEGESFLVLCSGGIYSISQSHSGPNFEHSMEFGGDVNPTGDARKVRFSYTVSMMHEDLNEGEKGHFALKGSAVLKNGKEIVLGHMGEQVLSVKATIDE